MSKVFGERLKKLRNEQGLYQSDVAQELNISQNTLSDWERGKTEPKIDQIIKLACFFDVTTDYLLGLENYIKNRKHA